MSTHDVRNSCGEWQREPALGLVVIAVAVPEVHCAKDGAVENDRSRQDRAAARGFDCGAVGKRGAQGGNVTRDEDGVAIENGLTPPASLVLLDAAERIGTLAPV